MRRLSLLVLIAALAAPSLLTGCHSKQPTSASTSNFKTYKLRGKVVSTNAQTGEVTLDHEAIPGFMEAMTMPYKLKDPSILSGFTPATESPPTCSSLRVLTPTFFSTTLLSSRRHELITSPQFNTMFLPPAIQSRISSSPIRMEKRFTFLSTTAKLCSSLSSTRAVHCPTSAPRYTQLRYH